MQFPETTTGMTGSSYSWRCLAGRNTSISAMAVTSAAELFRLADHREVVGLGDGRAARRRRRSAAEGLLCRNSEKNAGERKHHIVRARTRVAIHPEAGQ